MRPIVILGTPRSFTSLTAGIFRDHGVWFGQCKEYHAWCPTGSCENVATNYFGLKDPQGNALSLTAAGGDMVSEVVTHVRPRVTAGDGSTDLTVILFFRSTM